MARVKLSPILTDVSGKLGGSVFQKNQSGLGMKSLTHNINPNSIAQGNIKNFTFYLQQQWKSISIEDRKVWSDFIKYKNITQMKNPNKLISNMQYFIKCNIARLFYGYSLLLLPSFTACGQSNIEGSLYISSGRLLCQTSRAFVTANEFLSISVSYPISPGINYPSGNLRLLNYSVVDTSTIDITDDYIGVFGQLPPANSYVFMMLTTHNKANGYFFNNQMRKIQVTEPMILDDMDTNLECALSLTQLLSSYTGACVQLQRSSDADTQDFYFVNGFLDTASVSAWAGADTIYIMKIYDQSGNGNDFDGISTTQAPRLDSFNTIKLLGAQWFQKSSLFTIADGLPWCVVSVFQFTTDKTCCVWGSRQATNYYVRQYRTTADISYANDLNVLTSWSFVQGLEKRITILEADGTHTNNMNLQYNGDDKGSLTSNPAGLKLLSIGNHIGPPVFKVIGNMHHFIIFSRNLSSSEKTTLNTLP